MTWLKRGIDSGDPAACNTFERRDLAERLAHDVAGRRVAAHEIVAASRCSRSRSRPRVVAGQTICA